LWPNSSSTPDCGWRNSQPVSATGRNLLSAARPHALEGFHRRGSGIGATPLDDRFHETAQGTGKGLDERRNSTDRESFVPSLGAFPAFCHVRRQTTAEGQHLTWLGGNIHAEIPGVGARKKRNGIDQKRTCARRRLATNDPVPQEQASLPRSSLPSSRGSGRSRSTYPASLPGHAGGQVINSGQERPQDSGRVRLMISDDQIDGRRLAF
jgi:hypothetical protein